MNTKQNSDYKLQRDLSFPLERIVDKEKHLIELSLVKCHLCHLIPANPVKEIIRCEKFFCSKCIESHWDKTKTKQCPTCNQISVFKAPTKCDLLVFSKLKIKCKNQNCAKTFSLASQIGDLQEHESNCEFSKSTSKLSSVAEENIFSVGTNNYCFECGLISKSKTHSCIKYLCAKMINYETMLSEEIEKIKENLLLLKNEKTAKFLRKEEFEVKENLTGKIDMGYKSHQKQDCCTSFNECPSEGQNDKLLSFKKKRALRTSVDEKLVNNENTAFQVTCKNKSINAKTMDSPFALSKFSYKKEEPSMIKKVSIIITSSIFDKMKKLLFSKTLPFKNMSLIFKASEHNFSSSKFHELCDGVSPTLILVKDTDGNVFGGYTVFPWANRHGTRHYDRKKKNFLFSLDNEMIYKVKSPTAAVTFDIKRGPCFNKDLVIGDECHLRTTSSSYLGKSYKFSDEFIINSLTIKNEFVVCEYEVFHLF